MSLRVAVITPYHAEPLEMLRQAHDSVLAQTHPCVHVMVADGLPRREVDDWDALHIVLDRSHGPFGCFPRLVGAERAVAEGFDLIALLDADNWLRPDHVERLVALQAATGADFLTCGRILCRLDGSVMAPCPLTDPERFVDTSCLAYARGAFPLLPYWTQMPGYAQAICDRCVLQHAIASGVSRAHSPEPTVFYRCGKAGIYRLLGEPVPPGVSPPPDYRSAFDRWVAEGHPPLA